MKNLPACKTCVNSGFLCSSCQEKLDTGVLSQFELDLAKDLLVLEEEDKFGFLKNISFFKAIDFEDVVIIVVGKKDKIKFTQKLINWIKETYEVDELILVEQTKNPRAALESLIAPSKLISLNEIFLATGDIEFKGVLSKKDQGTILFTKEELEELILELTGNTIRIEFEQS
jgi:transcription antitermination factor NusA-like protein